MTGGSGMPEGISPGALGGKVSRGGATGGMEIGGGGGGEALGGGDAGGERGGGGGGGERVGVEALPRRPNRTPNSVSQKLICVPYRSGLKRGECPGGPPPSLQPRATLDETRLFGEAARKLSRDFVKRRKAP